MKFLNLLKKLKAYSTHPTHQMSAVIAKKNKIISVGFNKYKTHPKSYHSHKMIHAELAAILDNKFTDLRGSTIYIYREHKDGSFAIAKPCPSCMEMIKMSGIKNICYTTEGSFKLEEVC